MDAAKKVVKTLDKIITKINEVALVIALIAMFLLVFANVIGRYFFSFTYYWVDELSRYLMISLAFLGMGLAMRSGNHSSFNIVQNMLPDKGRKVLRALVLVITIVSMGALAYLGFQYAMRGMKNPTEALRWPAGYWYMMIPTGSLLFIWHILMISKDYVNQTRQSEVEREIEEGGKSVEDSAFLEDIELEANEEEEK